MQDKKDGNVPKSTEKSEVFRKIGTKISCTTVILTNTGFSRKVAISRGRPKRVRVKSTWPLKVPVCRQLTEREDPGRHGCTKQGEAEVHCLLKYFILDFLSLEIDLSSASARIGMNSGQ